MAQLVGHGGKAEFHRLHLLFILGGKVLVIEALAGGQRAGALQLDGLIDGLVELGHAGRHIVVPEVIIVRCGGDLVLDHQGHRLFEIGG